MERRRAYETSACTKGRVGGDGMEPIDNRCEPLEQLGIAIPEFVKRERLLFEYSKDQIRRLASIDRDSQRVVAEILPGSLRVLVQGSVEEGI